MASSCWGPFTASPRVCASHWARACAERRRAIGARSSFPTWTNSPVTSRAIPPRGARSSCRSSTAAGSPACSTSTARSSRASTKATRARSKRSWTRTCARATWEASHVLYRPVSRRGRDPHPPRTRLVVVAVRSGAPGDRHSGGRHRPGLPHRRVDQGAVDRGRDHQPARHRQVRLHHAPHDRDQSRQSGIVARRAGVLGARPQFRHDLHLGRGERRGADPRHRRPARLPAQVHRGEHASGPRGEAVTLRSLLVDFNSYFASVEQQVEPRLRGRPLGVVPMLADTTVCIAASVEAKTFGVKTGTKVAEARKLCPHIEFVVARHELYIDYHHRAVAVVDSIVPVRAVLSIDEMDCELTGRWRDRARALDLARKVKAELASHIGECLRTSIGIGPNTFIAKTASDMVKPDGLVVIEKSELPDRLFDLEVRALSGIGKQMEKRLARHGIRTVRDLCARSRDEMRSLWGGIGGEIMHDRLRGE